MTKPEIPAHLELAEAVLKRAQNAVRGKTLKNVRQTVTETPEASDTDPNRAQKIGQAALLLGVSRLATRSVPGALLVGGGFLAKKWLDKRKPDSTPE